MKAEEVSKTLDYNAILTWPSTQEHSVMLSHCESFRSMYVLLSRKVYCLHAQGLNPFVV
jgi:hypothetical protein